MKLDNPFSLIEAYADSKKNTDNFVLCFLELKQIKDYFYSISNLDCKLKLVRGFIHPKIESFTGIAKSLNNFSGCEFENNNECIENSYDIEYIKVKKTENNTFFVCI